MGGGWPRPHPSHFTPGERDLVSTVQKAAWAPGPVWIGAEKLAPLGFDPWTVQPVVGRYTEYYNLIILFNNYCSTGTPGDTQINVNTIVISFDFKEDKIEPIHVKIRGHKWLKRITLNLIEWQY